MNTIRIAIRNMSRQKKRSFLLGGAIAFGIFIVSLLNGFTGGMVNSIRENFSHMMAGHIYIRGSEVSQSGREMQIIRDDALLHEAVDKLTMPVKYITERSTATGTLIFGSKEINQRIDGVNWGKESYFKEKLMLNRGSLDELDNPRALILSENAAQKLGIMIGETLLIRLNTITGQQNVDEFKLIATTVDQSFIGNYTAYAHLAYINQLLNLEPGEYQALNIFLERMESMDAAKAELRTGLAGLVQLAPEAEDEDENLNTDEQGQGGHFGGGDRRAAGMAGMGGGLFSRSPRETWEGTRYTITTLNDMMSMVMSLVSFLNGFSTVILIILLVIIMVGIANTFRMILIERVREIGTIRALGMQKTGVRDIFLLEAFFICITGAFAGLLFSVIMMFFFSLIAFPTNTMFFLFLSGGHPAFSLDAWQVLFNFVLIAFFSLLAAFFPAMKAASLDPAKALGTHY